MKVDGHWRAEVWNVSVKMILLDVSDYKVVLQVGTSWVYKFVKINPRENE